LSLPLWLRRAGFAAIAAFPFSFLLAFVAYPLWQELWGSFSKWYQLKPAGFCGLSNYKALFRDVDVSASALHTVVYVLLTVPLEIALGLGTAWVTLRTGRGGTVAGCLPSSAGRTLGGGRLFLQRAFRFKRGGRPAEPARFRHEQVFFVVGPSALSLRRHRRVRNLERGTVVLPPPAGSAQRVPGRRFRSRPGRRCRGGSRFGGTSFFPPCGPCSCL